MHSGTVAVISRTSGALLLSRVQASAAELRRRTLAADDEQDSRVTPPSLLQFAQSDTEQTVRDDARTSSQAGVCGWAGDTLASASKQQSCNPFELFRFAGPAKGVGGRADSPAT
jgi:hypothetical protein